MSAIDLSIFDGVPFGYVDEVDPAEEIIREIEAVEAQAVVQFPQPASPAPLPPPADAPPAAQLASRDSDDELAAAVLPPAFPAPPTQSLPPPIQPAMSSADLRAAVKELLSARDLTQTTLKTLRSDLCQHLGLHASALDARQQELKDIVVDVVVEVSAKQALAHSCTEDLGPQDDRALRRTHNTTFSHPVQPRAADGTVLRPPGTFSREEIKNAFLSAIHDTNAAKQTPVVILLLVVFREHHAGGEVHYHVASSANRQYRFGPPKRALLEKFGLATHWSTVHDHYASTVAYGYLPSPHKPMSELDPVPLLWSASGTHPPLSEASRPPVNAMLIAKMREAARLARSEKGKSERFEEIHLWPIVVRENFAAGDDGREHLMAYAQRVGGEAMVKYCFANWYKLDDIVRKVWEIERVQEYIAAKGKSRMEVLHDATSHTCICDGEWLLAAKQIFKLNGINPSLWCAAMLQALDEGRSKGNLVCHVGNGGNEGKSFLFEPLGVVFGEEFVFLTPPAGGFPLLGMERARIALLDDWRFNEDIISYNLQLLWFEGKPFVIARPQNNFSSHLRYTKDAPIFISTLEADLLSVKRHIQQGDVSMMLKRLTVFKFTAVLTSPKKIPPCARCFSRFLLHTDGQANLGQSFAPAVSMPSDVPSAPSSSTAGRKRPREWSVEDVVAFLESCELGHVKDAFRDNGVDGGFLLCLSDDELMVDLGLTKLQVKKIRLRLPQ